MKRLLHIFLLFFFGVAVSFAQGSDFQKQKIAVLDFQMQGDGYETPDMGKIVAEWLITSLVKNGRFDVIERRLLEKVLEEQRVVMSGLVQEERASRLGNLLGAGVLITGTVMKLKDFTEINARIIDVSSGSIIAAESVKSGTTAKLQALILQMADKIMQAFPLNGYVIEREGKTILLDLGTRSGVRPGMLFDIVKEGKTIKHPKTGQILDVKRIQIGTVRITTARETISEAVILTEVAPHKIEYGQMVRSVVETPAMKRAKILRGDWDAYSGRPSKSRSAPVGNNTIKWTYSVPRIRDETYAGVNLYLSPPVSIENRVIRMTINATKGYPIYVRFYSFVAGFSKEDDDETYVPIDKLIGLTEGEQELLIDPSEFTVPEWWREENRKPGIAFNPGDVRILDFSANVDEDLGPVSDTLWIKDVMFR